MCLNFQNFLVRFSKQHDTTLSLKYSWDIKTYFSFKSEYLTLTTFNFSHQWHWKWDNFTNSQIILMETLVILREVRYKCLSVDDVKIKTCYARKIMIIPHGDWGGSDTRKMEANWSVTEPIQRPAILIGQSGHSPSLQLAATFTEGQLHDVYIVYIFNNIGHRLWLGAVFLLWWPVCRQITIRIKCPTILIFVTIS